MTVDRSRAGFFTFVVTDIEGSSRLWEVQPDRMRLAKAKHDAIFRATVESNGGSVVKMIGDGGHAVFANLIDAVLGSVSLQLALSDPESTAGIQLLLRCGVHVGDAQLRDDDYYGNTVNRVVRIMSSSHGGQILLSSSVVKLVTSLVREAVSFHDLGNVRRRDLAAPEHVYQLLHPRLRRDFPPLRFLEAHPHNLQQQSTSFVGRERETVVLSNLLGSQ